MTQPLTTTDLEKLVDEVVPCGGSKKSRQCDQPAVLMSVGHGCCPLPASAFKCIVCWQVWYRSTVKLLNGRGVLCCGICDGVYHTVESFSDYRPF